MRRVLCTVSGRSTIIKYGRTDLLAFGYLKVVSLNKNQVVGIIFVYATFNFVIHER